MLTTTDDAPVPRIMTPKQVAVLLQISTRTVSRWIHSGALRATRTSLPRGRLPAQLPLPRPRPTEAAQAGE